MRQKTLGLTILFAFAAVAGQSAERDGFLIGFGLGGGALDCEPCESSGAFAGTIEIGGSIKRDVALLVETVAVGHEEESEEFKLVPDACGRPLLAHIQVVDPGGPGDWTDRAKGRQRERMGSEPVRLRPSSWCGASPTRAVRPGPEVPLRADVQHARRKSRHRRAGPHVVLENG